jgi:hypothetical protein
MPMAPAIKGVHFYPANANAGNLTRAQTSLPRRWRRAFNLVTGATALAASITDYRWVYKVVV